MEEKNTQPTTDNTKNEKNKRTIKPPCESIYQANLASIGKEIGSVLENVPELPIAVESEISFKGIKNPIYLVIVGFSTRAILDQARRAGKEIQSVLIIEPDLRIFLQTMRREYIGDIIQDPNVDIITGIPIGELSWHIYKAFSTHNATGHRASRCQNPEVFVDPFAYTDEKGKPTPAADQITEIIFDSAKQVMLSLGCASDTFFRWEQTTRNIENIKSSFQVKSLFDKFKDMPAIIVGGGPSVDDFISAYKKYDLKDKALIISCDASLPRLLREGIKPHLVTRCERKISQIFYGVTKKDTKDVFYAAYPWTPPEFFDLFEDSIMLFRDNGVCGWTGFEPGGVNGGVSAANAALELAYLFGVKEIYSTGIDLCFIDGKSHVPGTEVEFDIEASKAKWTEVETNEGTKATTIPVWHRCLNEYVHAVQKHAAKGIPFFNTSLKGAKIEGTKVITWEEAAAKFDKTFDIVAQIRANLTKHGPDAGKRYDERKAKTIGMLKNFRKDVAKLFLYLDDYMLTSQREEERCINQLKSHMDPREFFSNIKGISTSLANVYNKAADQLDKFKNKYFKDVMFSLTVLDTCMTDFFQTENKLNSLKNTIPVDHERIKTYIGLNASIFRIFETYAERLQNLLENGVEKHSFDPESVCHFEEKEYPTPKKVESKLILPPGYKNKKKAVVHDHS